MVEESEPLRRGKRWKRRKLLIALVVLILAIVIAATIFAFYRTEDRPSSHRYIVTAADLGEGWETSYSIKTPPEGWNINGSDNSAYVGIGYDNGTVRASGNLVLAVFATAEEANDTYIDLIKRFYDTSSGNWSSVNVSYGDHAILISRVDNQGIIYERLLFMQKGTAVVVMSIISTNNVNVTIPQVEDVARIQAQKLP